MKLRHLGTLTKQIQIINQQHQIELNADSITQIFQAILLRSGFEDFVIHLKMMDYFILKQICFGPFCNILVNWWMCILSMIRPEE